MKRPPQSTACAQSFPRLELLMITLTVNGHALQFEGDQDMPLLWYLRDIEGLTGTKLG